MLESDVLDIWEGRTFQIHKRPSQTTSVSCVSYNVNSEKSINKAIYPNANNWRYRIEVISQEVATYNTDILLIQDVDHFDEWRSQLIKIKYDCVFGRRNGQDTGVLIAYKRWNYAPFKTYTISLDPASELDQNRDYAFKQTCKSDDVGLICLLQPLEACKAAVLAATVQLSDKQGPLFDDIRTLQSWYFSSRIELANAEYQLPIIVGTCLNGEPQSVAYHVWRTGRLPFQNERPKKCGTPKCKAFSRSSVRVSWLPPMIKSAGGSPSFISGYRIFWRPGGSKILNFLSVDVNAGDCTRYVSVPNAKGDLRTVRAKELSHVINKLCTDVPYEFRVAAVSQLGFGPWSDPSPPIVLRNPPKAPAMSPSKHMSSLKEIFELQEQEKMFQCDEEFQNRGKAAIFTTQLETQRSTFPTFVDGSWNLRGPRNRSLPISANPRLGWRHDLGGGVSESVKKDLSTRYVLSRTLLRNKNGEFIAPVCESSTGEVMAFTNSMEISSSQFSATDYTILSLSSPIDISNLPVSKNQPPLHTLNASPLNLDGGEASPPATSVVTDNDNAILDCKFVISRAGALSDRHAHGLCLRSAYEKYSSGGEPVYTASKPCSNDANVTGCLCLDYIFYSDASLALESVLRMPPLYTLRGEDPRDWPTNPSPQWRKPSPSLASLYYAEAEVTRLPFSASGSGSDKCISIKQLRVSSKASAYASIPLKTLTHYVLTERGGTDATKRSAFLAGTHWLPFSEANTCAQHQWLPNKSFNSSRLALCAVFNVKADASSSTWHVVQKLTKECL